MVGTRQKRGGCSEVGAGLARKWEVVGERRAGEQAGVPGTRTEGEGQAGGPRGGGVWTGFPVMELQPGWGRFIFFLKKNIF